MTFLGCIKSSADQASGTLGRGGLGTGRTQIGQTWEAYYSSCGGIGNDVVKSGFACTDSSSSVKDERIVALADDAGRWVAEDVDSTASGA